MYKQFSFNVLATYKSVPWSLPDTQQIQKVAVDGDSLMESTMDTLEAEPSTPWGFQQHE